MPKGGGAGPIELVVPDESWASVAEGLFPAELVSVVVDAGGAEGSGGALSGRRVEVRAEGGGYVVRGSPELGLDRLPDGAPDASEPTGPGEAVAALELALTRGLLRDRAHRVQLHAAGAVIDGVGVVALGPAGAGKSSLALAWSRVGRPLLGDDVVLVDGDGAARAFRRLIKVDVGRLAEHGIRPETTHAWVPGWEEAWVDPREGGGWSSGPVAVGLVVLLDRHEEGAGRGPRAQEVERPAALGALLESALPGGLRDAAALEPLCRLLDESRSVRLSYASSLDAARFLIREAGRSRHSPARKERSEP